MFLKNSRYLNARRFDPRADGTVPFKGVRARVIALATGVIEHGLQPEERFDWLGTHYFNDSRLWWRIVDANPDLLCALELEVLGLVAPPGLSGPSSTADEDRRSEEFGTVVLIPRAKE